MTELICPQVEKLRLIPQFEQRTPEWYAQRNNAITASDIPTVLNENKYKTSYALLVDKCGGSKPFLEMMQLVGEIIMKTSQLEFIVIFVIKKYFLLDF